MVLITAVRDYINRMLQDISGMKVLILDSQTVSVVSVAYSQSELLQKEVFLVELIDSIAMSKESMSHLKAVYFLRPTSENIQRMKRQLAKPRFGEYHLFFSNLLNNTQLHILADSDEHEVVQQVQEFYADFVPIDPYHFSLNSTANHMYMLPAVVDPTNVQLFCDRVVDGLAALYLAFKRRPVIRYSRTSDIAKRIAQEAAKLMYQQESGLFDFRRTEISPLLLIIDRRDDSVTPLLNQWTYQAMVHELIGIQDNKVDLGNIAKLPKDQQEVVLSSEQDAFFKVNMFENFGDIGMNIKRMVDEFQQVAKSNQKIQTIEDMAKFVDNYPEYRKMHGNVSKHVTLVTEMSKIVEERKLMLVSQTEQDLACNGGQGAAFEGEELNQNGELFVSRQPQLKVKLVDGSSLVVAIVLNTIPKGTTEVVLSGNLNKIAYSIASALCQRGIQVTSHREEDFRKLKAKLETSEFINNIALSESFSQKIWLVGGGLSKEDQQKASKGTLFVPFSQFPPKKLRKDCYYHTTPAMLSPNNLQNIDSCENWLPRRVMSAWRIAGVLHALEGWGTHECGNAMYDMEKVWQASLHHGFHPLMLSTKLKP